MTCSLQVYRVRIGTFFPRKCRKSWNSRTPNSTRLIVPWGIILLMIIYLSIVLNSDILTRHSVENENWKSFKCKSVIDRRGGLRGTESRFIWDPGSRKSRTGGPAGTSSSVWLSRKERNKITHLINGNRGQRGRGINCVYWNKGPAYLCNKQLDIETIIEAHKPHILGLGEANVSKAHDLNDIQQSEYSLHLDSCIDNPDLGMARVAVYTHKSLKVKRRADLEDDTIAAVWLECGLPNQNKILYCTGYRQWRLLGQKDNTSATTTEQLARWLKFLEVWEKALEEDKEVIVALDANLDFLTWRKEDLPPHHSSVRLKSLIDALFERIFPLGVTQLVTGATRMESGQPKTGLDHLYTNRPDKMSLVQTYYTGVSDHKLLKFTRFSKSFRPRPRFIRKRMYKDFDADKYIESLAASNLEEVLDCIDVNEASELLVNKINKVLDKMAPIRTVQVRAKYAPWLSRDTKDLQTSRNNAQKTAAQTDSPEDWRIFRALRNQVTSRLRADKREWEKANLDDKENTPTEIWSKVRAWLGWGGGGTPTQILSEGQVVTSPAGLSNCMNKFFLNKIKKLRSTIPGALSDPLSKIKEAMRNRTCSFSIQETSEEDIRKVVSKLKNSAATGVDNIDTKIVKLSAQIIAPALTHIVNLSIRTSTFPDCWKYAKVIPLLKSTDSDPLLPKSYRPVALLPVLSKILEKVVFIQLIRYLEENNLVHPNLHGSRSWHNTATALVQLYDRWAEEIETNKMVGVLMCDQSAAFDLCDHTLLLEKLKLMGLEQSAIAWVGSYLTGRKQSCFVDGYLSSPLDLLSCGVPQGSIGGPLLWLCFTCDQPDVIHEHEIDGQDHDRGCVVNKEQEEDQEQVEPGSKGDCGALVGYVDDGAYSYAHRDPAVLSQVLTRKYNLLEEWINGNKLVINPDKTHLMVMGSKKIMAKRQQVSIQAGGFTIRPTETEKLLGGHLHQSLQWNHHLSDGKKSLSKQLTTRINGLKKIAASATFKTRLMVANGVIMSKVVYLITVWGGAQQYLLKGLQVQQLAAARCVCGFVSRWWSRKKILQRVGWLSIRQLVYFHTVLQAHKTICSGKPALLSQVLTTNYPYRTRSATMGQIRFGEKFFGSSSIMNASFKNRAVHWYNEVPASVRTGSITSVKRKLKDWIMKNIPIDWG